MNNNTYSFLKKGYAFILILFACFFVFLSKSFAAGIYCTTQEGIQHFVYDIELKAEDNVVGYESPWIGQTKSLGDFHLSEDCTGNNIWFRLVEGEYLTLAQGNGDPLSGQPVWFDIQGNEYLQVALQIYVGGGVTSYVNVPASLANGCWTGSVQCSDLIQTGGQVKFKFRIKNRFVGHAGVNNLLIARVHASTEPMTPVPLNIISEVRLNAFIVVDQKCWFDVGDIVLFDFGTLSSTSFIGNAGDPARDVTPLQKRIGIECLGIDAQQMLTMRVEGNNTVGNALVPVEENKRDVGFSVTSSDSSEALIPNTLSSNIPFQLDDNYRSQVVLKAWPVAVTGNKPEPGPVKASGYLRIDFQ